MDTREQLRERVFDTCTKQGLTPQEAEEVFRDVAEALSAERGKLKGTCVE